MSRQPDRPPPPPVVQRLRVRYAKRDRMRFTSHRDVARALERALRRAELPMAYSAGFSPHPKVSYAGASPTGVASEAEYLEISLAERRDPDDVRRSLDAALPPGIDVVEVVEASGASLGDRIAASRWRVELRDVDPADAAGAIPRFLALDTAPVERLTKDGTRTVDARAAVIHLSIAEYRTSMAAITRLEGGPGAPDAGETARNVPCAILDLVVRHTTPAVRPDDVMKALRQAGAPAPDSRHPPGDEAGAGPARRDAISLRRVAGPPGPAPRPAGHRRRRGTTAAVGRRRLTTRLPPGEPRLHPAARSAPVRSAPRGAPGSGWENTPDARR